ncbi:MAG: sensor histidine kinase [Ktedonobacterales bacterium]
MTWVASMLLMVASGVLDVGTSVKSAYELLWNAGLFTGLMLLHACLHWLSLSRPQWRRWYPVYALVQGILVCVIVATFPLVGYNLFLTLGLLLALVLESAALLERARPVTLAALWYFTLFVIYLITTYGGRIGWGFAGYSKRFGWLLLSKRELASQLGWGLLVIVPLILFACGHVMTYVRQARAHERTQSLLRELEVAHAQVASYALRVEDLTRTAERQRLARDLHDTLVQGVTGLIMQLEVIDSHLTLHNQPRAQEIVHMAMSGARETLATARGAIHDLRVESALPADLTLLAQDEINRFTSAAGIPCECDIAALVDVPLALRESIMRLIGEGLANVARHARAHRARVSAISCEQSITVEVHDDGAGFAPDVVAGQPGHYGLLGLSERAWLVGGTLQVLSMPGQGTTVRFSAPLYTSTQALRA